MLKLKNVRTANSGSVPIIIKLICRKYKRILVSGDEDWLVAKMKPV